MRKKALITGASGGIGQAIAEETARLGYDVILHYNSDSEGALSLMHRIEEKYGVYAHCISCDLSDAGCVEVFCEKVRQLGEIAVIVNNAGASYQELFQLTDDKKVRQLFEINLMSAMSITKALVPDMIKNRFGRIINISSMWGITGASCEVHYSTSKAALIGFTKALAKELGPSGITVNCIAPGYIETKMNACHSEDTVKEIVDSTPVMRTGKPSDVAAAAAFFISDSSGFITGQTLSVDGGFCI